MPSPIVIATISRETGQEGVQTHFNQYRANLAERGTAVRFVNPLSRNRLLALAVFAVRRLFDPALGTLSVWWYRRFHQLFLRRALAAELADGGPRLIYAQCPLSAAAALAVRRDPAQKVVMAVHYNGSQADEWVLKGKLAEGGRVYRGIKALEASLPPRLDGLVFVSEYMRRRVLESTPDVSDTPSIMLPNFTAAPAAGAPRGAARDVIAVGMLEPRKNQEYILRVLAEARKRGHAYSLTVVGSGPDRRRLVGLAAELGLGERVRFVGYRADVADWLPQHRVLAHSALMESFGVVLVEAMAHGLPVLAAPVGGVPEVFSDGVEGLYWPLDDPGAGAETLVRLLESRELYGRLSRAARQRFAERFEANAVAPRLTEFLLGAARRDPA